MSAVIWIDEWLSLACTHLQRQLQPAIDAAVDAPRGVEVPQRMQALVLRTALVIDEAYSTHFSKSHGSHLKTRHPLACFPAPLLSASNLIGAPHLGHFNACTGSISSPAGGSHWPPDPCPLGQLVRLAHVPVVAASPLRDGGAKLRTIYSRHSDHSRDRRR